MPLRPAALAARAAPEPAAPPREATAVALLAAGAALCPFLLGWLSLAPNRLLSPRPAALPMTPGVTLGLGAFLFACWPCCCWRGGSGCCPGPRPPPPWR
ncbi:hypothetical protein [Teichococcus aestuarii]|uniref:hypothetical protein n=1 Tax=Teichococcus aestuarii TaxID=568898 RepID=UPI003607A4FF